MALLSRQTREIQHLACCFGMFQQKLRFMFPGCVLGQVNFEYWLATRILWDQLLGPFLYEWLHFGVPWIYYMVIDYGDFITQDFVIFSATG